MKNFYSSFKNLVVLLALFCCCYTSAQNASEISNTYKNYTKAAREIVYLHLNKSTYIKGEDIGFTAYVLDKKTRKPSLITTNLYVSIEDKERNILKQKLIRVKEGVASDVFTLDSLFTSGHYNIKAFTNWMRNFNEKNYFIETIKVMDPDVEAYYSIETISNEIDAQFLPESGHLLNNTVNTIGVTIKDRNGYGVSFSKGEVIDQDNNVISTFETNQFGIGKFQLIPQIGNTYSVKTKYANKDFTLPLGQKIERNGILLSVKKLKSKLFISAVTNNSTLNSIKNKKYTLLLHNGDTYKTIGFVFTENTTVNKAIDYENINPGINIFTLFDENTRPIAERLFFNYEGLDIKKPHIVSAIRQKDSTLININLSNIDTGTDGNVSVSILPSSTKSYKRHNNLVSYTFLEPYVRGLIEQPKYYFTEITEKKKYELDNLLITQGWSSYSWTEIFNNPNKIKYPFEQGITVKANIQNRDKDIRNEKSYVIHPLSEDPLKIVPVANNEKSFVLENTFPDENSFFVSKIDNEDKLTPVSLYMQYFPSTIPQFNTNNIQLLPKPEYKTAESLDNQTDYNLLESNEVHKLSEVLLTHTNKKDSIKVSRFGGRVFDMSIYENSSYDMTLKEFLVSKGLIISTRNNSFGVFKKTFDSITYLRITLDGEELTVPSILNSYRVSNIDFVEIDTGFYGISGHLVIYSKKDNPPGFNKKTVSEFNFPLTFSKEKKYYTPKFYNYSDEFFESFGVVAWKAKHNIGNGNIRITIANYNKPVTLFIEGLTSNGTFISEEKTISLE
ncbi:hypothetical protein [uncultured Winogradskyella sp.]|uniref:hypothetical protein n=1 Tax=uncultured Winogradskyella sp. TaxID=395353 RepID=UPI00262B2586|nr:hypothetical protein [uncultured Winogradskyella sp.]